METQSSGNNTSSALAPMSVVVASVAGLMAAWIAAGSTGLLGHALRHALTWVCLGVAVAMTWPDWWKRGWTQRIIVLAGAVVAILMTASLLPAVNALAAAVILAVLAEALDGRGKRVISLTAVTAVVFCLYQLARTAIPLVWIASDSIGGAIGRVAQSVTGEPLWVGSTFAGMDFLVIMTVLYVGWLIGTARPRGTRALWGALFILGGHLAYLSLLAFVPRIIDALPPKAVAAATTGIQPPPPPWTWAATLRLALPWNMPLVALAIHSTIIACMLGWAKWPAVAEAPAAPEQPSPEGAPPAAPSRFRWLRCPITLAAIVLALALPLMATLSVHKASLQGKKIVAYKEGFLNWMKPEHGQYGRLTVGMYGMLDWYFSSMGASFLISPDLSEADLSNADVLVLLFPDKPWSEGQLERIWSFTRRGGSLLVLGEHTVKDNMGNSRFNEVLAPTNMRVRFDCSTFTVGGWLQSYEALAHPISAGLPDDRNQYGVVIGASLETQWPAQPLLIGRWGWSDWGDEGSGQAKIGTNAYEGGELLGDQILAAEQPLGKGKVIAFGDTSHMTNGITVGAHVFTSRLLGYLADGQYRAQPPWRQELGIVTAVILLGLLVWRPDGKRLIAVGVALGASLVVCSALTTRAGQILPDGRGKTPNNLAYIDLSHIPSFSEESWRVDGVGGLTYTLMRNGFVTLMLPDFTAERLERAGVVIVAEPGREFSRSERKIARKFVENGGILIMTVGFDDGRSGPAESLMSEFGFAVGPDKDTTNEIRPMGFFKAPYLNLGNGRLIYVRFWAAFPIKCSDPNAKVIARGKNDWPVIITSDVGKGKVAVIGDSCFTWNRNLENEGGEMFEGKRENADFWRWFLTTLRGQEVFIPTVSGTATPAPRR